MALSQATGPPLPLTPVREWIQDHFIVDLRPSHAAGLRLATRLRDTARTTTRTFQELVELVEEAGGRTRRLDVFTIERPIEPWFADAGEPDRIRRELTAELDGGPKTGARPRLIGRELWFAQSWAYVAAEPVSRDRTAAAPRPR